MQPTDRPTESYSLRFLSLLVLLAWQAPLWRRVQAAFRGFQVRLHDKDVNRILVEVYQNRRQEGLNAAAVFTQATARRFLARLRMSAWRELKTQRCECHSSMIVPESIDRSRGPCFPCVWCSLCLSLAVVV